MNSMRLSERLSRIFRVLNVIVVNVVVALLAFLALEYGARTFTYLRTGRELFRRNTFISCWFTTYDYPPPIVGADGKLFFRHRESWVDPLKPASTVRIIAVGGSTTVCEQAYRQDGVDYPSALERKLARELGGLDVEVLNAGADAYSTAHSLVNIELRLVEFHPDVILLMHNINDSTVNYFLDGAAPDYSNKYLRSYFLNPNLQGTLSLAGLLTQSRFLSRLGLPQMLANRRGDLRPENDFGDGLRYFARNLMTIAAVCRLNGIEIVFLSQPSSMEPHPFVNLNAFVAYNNEIERLAVDRGVEFIDMFTLMGHEAKYFYDQVHYTPDGVERFADLVAAELIPTVRRIREGEPTVAGQSRANTDS